ncbi:MAG: DUF1778 domain-containing protein [Sphingobacteriaceae bacterium]|nr:MAG: DUF1778 domain-containing protein [Sphingobacteriaceae bacterium]
MQKPKIRTEQESVILTSKKDQEVFFTAILNPLKPSSRLVKAAKRYQQLYNHNK